MLEHREHGGRGRKWKVEGLGPPLAGTCLKIGFLALVRSLMATHPPENLLLEDDSETKVTGSDASRKARSMATSPSVDFPLELPRWAC